MLSLLARAVAEEDRLDLERLDRPLSGLRFESAEAFGKHLREYVQHDLARRSDPAHSADLGAFRALLSVYGHLPDLRPGERLSAGSHLSDLDGWWHGFFSYFASGPLRGGSRSCWPCTRRES